MGGQTAPLKIVDGFDRDDAKGWQHSNASVVSQKKRRAATSVNQNGHTVDQ